MGKYFKRRISLLKVNLPFSLSGDPRGGQNYDLFPHKIYSYENVQLRTLNVDIQNSEGQHIVILKPLR